MRVAMKNEELKNLASAKCLVGKTDKRCYDTGPCSERMARDFKGIMPILKRTNSETRSQHSSGESGKLVP